MRVRGLMTLWGYRFVSGACGGQSGYQEGLTGCSDTAMTELVLQPYGVPVLQTEPRHLELLFVAVARQISLMSDLPLVCQIDYAQLAQDDLALGVCKPLPSQLRT